MAELQSQVEKKTISLETLRSRFLSALLLNSGNSEAEGISATKSSTILQAKRLLLKCAEPCQPGESIKAIIRRVASRLDLPFSRVQDMWYGEARRIEAWEIDRMREVAFAADLEQSLLAVTALRTRMSGLKSRSADQAVAGLDKALAILNDAMCKVSSQAA